MAETTYSANLQETFWAYTTWYEMENLLTLRKFMGKDENSPIVVKNDLLKGAGDTIRFSITMNLDGPGVTGDNPLMGNEEPLTIYDESVTIDQQRNAVRMPGRMSRQRTKLNFRESSRKGLGRWLADHVDEMGIRILCGDTGATLGAVGTAATNIIYGGDATSDGDIATSDYLTTLEIERVKLMAELKDPQMKPVKTQDGEEMWVLICHPTQYAMMRAKDSNLRTAMERALPRAGNNPLFRGGSKLFQGARLIWDNVAIHTSRHIYSPAANIRRAILLGAQAGCFAVGEEPFWVEDDKSELADYKNKPGLAAGRVCGMVKNVFNSVDFGVYCIDTYAPSTGIPGVGH